MAICNAELFTKRAVLSFSSPGLVSNWLSCIVILPCFKPVLQFFVFGSGSLKRVILLDDEDLSISLSIPFDQLRGLVSHTTLVSPSFSGDGVRFLVKACVLMA